MVTITNYRLRESKMGKPFVALELQGDVEFVQSLETALLIGRLRMYPLLPKQIQAEIPPLYLGEAQVGTVVKDYFRDDAFSRSGDGNLNLWSLYNLLTGANKSSYIDTFTEKSANAFHFTERIRYALMGKADNWFLN